MLKEFFNLIRRQTSCLERVRKDGESCSPGRLLEARGLLNPPSAEQGRIAGYTTPESMPLQVLEGHMEVGQSGVEELLSGEVAVDVESDAGLSRGRKQPEADWRRWRGREGRRHSACSPYTPDDHKRQTILAGVEAVVVSKDQLLGVKARTNLEIEYITEAHQIRWLV